jgi:hypothetical protein
MSITTTEQEGESCFIPLDTRVVQNIAVTVTEQQHAWE